MATEFSPVGLRVLREVAQTGSFSAAALSLGYTQSAVSRQVAALEAAAGRRLFDRGRHGVTFTPAGARLLTSAIRVIDELDSARRELAGDEIAARPVRLGAFATAAAGLVPRALATLPRQLKVTLREATTPALTRGLRAGTLDLAVLAQAPPFRPPDAETPALELTPLSERELAIAVPASHPFAGARGVEVAQLEGQVWVASRSDTGDTLLGAWPGLAERPDVRYVVRDLAREAPDRRGRPRDHHRCARHRRCPARRGQGRRRARRAAGNATHRSRPPTRKDRRPDSESGRRTHRRRRSSAFMSVGRGRVSRPGHRTRRLPGRTPANAC